MSAALTTAAMPPVATQGEVLWDHCRNSLGIARLLVHERRSDRLVATACRMAVETACRVALIQAGRAFDGDIPTALSGLAAPEALCQEPEGLLAGEMLSHAERRVTWLAGWLRAEAPGRSWSC
jgi:hypothetical protein